VIEQEISNQSQYNQVNVLQNLNPRVLIFKIDNTTSNGGGGFKALVDPDFALRNSEKLKIACSFWGDAFEFISEHVSTSVV